MILRKLIKIKALILLSYFAFCVYAKVPADPTLQPLNSEYIARLLGGHGVLDTPATDQQARMMIDGAITAGITDRLYGYDHRAVIAAVLQHRKAELTGNKKLHAQLALAFYLMGRENLGSVEDVRGAVAAVCNPLDPNFDAAFNHLSRIVYTKGEIFVYMQKLEDVIKRTSVPLNIDALKASMPAVVVAGPPSSVVVGGEPKQRHYTDAEIDSLGMPGSGIYNRLKGQGETPESIVIKLGRMGRIIEPKYEAGAGNVVAAVAAEAAAQDPAEAPPKAERYYNDDELEAALPDNPGGIGQYKVMKGRGLPAKNIRMAPGLPAKYEGE